MSITGLARGGLLYFASAVTSSVFTYTYLILISALGGPGVVGTASSVLSLSLLISGIAVLGVPIGVQRFLGRELGRGSIRRLNMYFWSSLSFTMVLCLISASLVWAASAIQLSLFGFSDAMLVMAGVLTLLGFSGALIALFATTARTKYMAVSNLVSGIAKVGMAGLLVYLGWGWFGAVLGLVFANASLILLMITFALRELRRLGGVRANLSSKAMSESLRAGAASWPPTVLTLLGQQLSVLVIFSFIGELEAGIFYVAYAIFTIVYMVPTSLMAVLFPAMSGLTSNDARKLAAKGTKLCFAIGCPIIAFLIFYPGLLLSAMGGTYLRAAPSLSMLCLSIIPLTLVLGVYSLIYALGSYWKVLGIGLMTEAPRIILYYLLIPQYQEFGAALSFMAGAIAGLIAALLVARTDACQLPIRSIAIAVIAPFGLALLSFTIGVDWFVAAPLILFVSMICYGRLRVIDRAELRELARAVASEKAVAGVSHRLGWLIRIMYGQ